ncbi:Alpha-tubulin N-acetyltransferase [Armadillidium nasatum]|uniref:Alpha-tubulin N-acetyltransferase n=1 Tax=Armadillidium nasatum TaxID=96803 RepID=A0A5N5TBF1_9CRUS|nr:Alpha-tubulin N-acetyltransferase [Armadillidium nasatum]
MEFRFDVSNVLEKEITCVDNSLIIPGWKSSTRNRVEYQQLYEIINAIGEASSFAQSLNRIITSADKLQNSDHILYLMKEEEKDRAVVVGMLKIGRKKLFVLDPNQVTKETAPLCVLDFYIHESRQRRGYGRRLFEYMLMHQNIDPGHMAVDKPSDKFLSFLKRHYGLEKQIPQINNFVVYTSFFQERPVTSEEAALTYVNRSNRSSRTASPEGSPSPGNSRKASNANQFAGKPSRYRESSMSDILHGRPDRHTVSARLNPRHQTTLDWMRGSNPGSGGETPYYSRTPSHTGSPLARTPRDTSPRGSHPATPPKELSRGGSRQHSVEVLDGVDGLNDSVAPTPATSPQRYGPPKEETIVQNGKSEVDAVNEQLEHLSVGEAPCETPGKTGGWRDSVSRSSEGLVEHMSSAKGSTMTGVLNDNDSVHGHLKFHHHALW